MKRYGNLYKDLCSIDNITLAYLNAKNNKSKKSFVIEHDKHIKERHLKLQQDLINNTFKSSKYKLGVIYEPKERLIFKLPFYPDRIVHHSILNITKDIWVKSLIKSTYNCLDGRGIHACAKDVRKSLNKYPNETKYCLKLDIKKFYHNIDHYILKSVIRKKIKDKELLNLIDKIIDSTNDIEWNKYITYKNKYNINDNKGVPIGNYTSSYFANLYLNELDHLCKEELRCKFYFRYGDDIVILHNNKDYLHKVLIYIKLYLKTIKLEIKDNYQIFPVDKRGIDFVGYVFYHTHTRIRKTIKQNIFKLVNNYVNHKISKNIFVTSMASYYGWMKYSDSRDLLHFIQLKTGIKYSIWDGEETRISRFYGKCINIYDIDIHKKYYVIHFLYHHKSYKAKSIDKTLFYFITKYHNRPFIYTMSKSNFRLYIDDKKRLKQLNNK